MTTPSETPPPILDGLQAVPGGFGQPSYAAFAAAFTSAARQMARTGEAPPVLFVMGEPLAGKSTFLSHLIASITQAPPPEVIRPYLIRWGDTIRAGKKRGVVAPERQFGDLTADEFAGTSRLLADAAGAARQAAAGQGPALVVVEAPGVTMLRDPSGGMRGLDRGYSFAQALVRDPSGFLMVLCADQRVRDTHLTTRHAALAAGGPDVREATQLAANRIRAQVTDLLFALGQAGTIQWPEPLPVSPLTREALDDHPAYRNEAVLRAYLPHLFRDDLGAPAERAFIGLNAYREGDVRPDLALLDRYDWTHEHFGI